MARDGIEPPTPAFSGCLASNLSGPESADIIEVISVVHSSIWDGFDRTMVVYWSCRSDQFQTLDVLSASNGWYVLTLFSTMSLRKELALTFRCVLANERFRLAPKLLLSRSCVRN